MPAPPPEARASGDLSAGLRAIANTATTHTLHSRTTPSVLPITMPAISPPSSEDDPWADGTGSAPVDDESSDVSDTVEDVEEPIEVDAITAAADDDAMVDEAVAEDTDDEIGVTDGELLKADDDAAGDDEKLLETAGEDNTVADDETVLEDDDEIGVDDAALLKPDDETRNEDEDEEGDTDDERVAFDDALLDAADEANVADVTAAEADVVAVDVLVATADADDKEEPADTEDTLTLAAVGTSVIELSVVLVVNTNSPLTGSSAIPDGRFTSLLVNMVIGCVMDPLSVAKKSESNM